MYRTDFITQGDKRWAIFDADSIGDVLHYLDQTRRSWGSSSIEYCSDGWRGTRTYKEAIEQARFGWPEGRAQLKEGLDTTNVLKHGQYQKAQSLDVAGSHPCVPVAVAGDPLNMWTYGLEKSKTKPVVRIVVNTSVSAGVSTKVIINRGAAILSWVDALEAQDVRCEIYAAKISSAMGSGSANRGCTGFFVKRAQDVLDLDRAAFALLSPSMNRRIMFGLYERDASLQYGFQGSYGMPCNDVPPHLDMPHSVYFHGQHLKNPEWKSAETAVKAVEEAIMKSLQQSEAINNQEG